MSRQQRQRDEVLALLERGDVDRGVVLAREHLLEFPGDAEVQAALDAQIER